MKYYIKLSGCYDCGRAVCDECDHLRPDDGNFLAVHPVSRWQLGFNDGYAGHRQRYNSAHDGYTKGFHAGENKREEERRPHPKDHEIALAVNELTEIARTYHGTQQLRDRISRVVVKLVKG